MNFNNFTIKSQEVVQKAICLLYTSYDDELILSTDRGEVRCYTTHAGELLHKIDLLNKQYAENLAESKSKSNMAWIILIVALSRCV